MKLSVIVPIFNERLYLPEVFRRILAAPYPPEVSDLEVIAIDDGSSDGSWEWLKTFAARGFGKEGHGAASRATLRVLRHERNQGKGSCIQDGVAASTGDLVLIQDSDLEYHPEDYPKLLAPILVNDADAVLGSRFLGTPRRVLYFWHATANRVLNFFFNILCGSTLTDLMTGYKVMRGELARSIRLTSNGFGIEPEICARLTKGNVRLYEVAISYSGRTYAEGKKITRWNALMLFVHVARFSLFGGTSFKPGMRQTLTSLYHASEVLYVQPLRSILEKLQINPPNVCRVLEVGSGVGSVTRALLHFDELVATDIDHESVRFLNERFSFLPGFKAVQWDATLAPQDPRTPPEVSAGKFDLIVAFNVLEHLEQDQSVLEQWSRLLNPGGVMVILVPFSGRLFTPIDEAVGHFRRYGRSDLNELFAKTGGMVLLTQYMNPLGILGWIWNGKILKRAELPDGQVRLYHLIKPIVHPFERLISRRVGLSIVTAGRWNSPRASGG
jgi:glycosyltransferase involved in cell wall biosynthesis